MEVGQIEQYLGTSWLRQEWGEWRKMAEEGGSHQQQLLPPPSQLCLALHGGIYMVAIFCPQKQIQEYTTWVNPKRQVTSKLSPRNMSFKVYYQSQKKNIYI